MPVYEFVCASCRRAFERYVKSFTEPVSCPDCLSPDVEKQLSTFAMAGATAGSGGGCGCGRGGCGCH
jgi:putative FmdB family regulatory protein